MKKLKFQQVNKKCHKCGKLIKFLVSGEEKMTAEEFKKFWSNNELCGFKEEILSPENYYYHGRCGINFEEIT